MAILDYQLQVQRLLHDSAGAYFAVTDLFAYINEARSQVAIESQSIRVLISGFVGSIAVVTGGINYDPTSYIVISGGGSGGMGAVAVPTIVGGAVTAVTVTSQGAGYDTVTTATLFDPTGAGSGAKLTVSISGANLQGVGQENYSFASRNAAAQLVPGVAAIQGVFSVSTSWGSIKPTLRRMVWPAFQAYARAWTGGYTGNPAICAQYGQGSKGSIFLCPIPSAVFSMDWDTFCTPLDLNTDADVEALPYPWTVVVKYYAAGLALDNAQREAEAEKMFAKYAAKMKASRAFAETAFIPDMYDE